MAAGFAAEFAAGFAAEFATMKQTTCVRSGNNVSPARCEAHKNKKAPTCVGASEFFGGASLIRTGDLRIMIPSL